MYRTILTLLFLGTTLIPVVADDNDVVISEATDNYRVTLRDGRPVVVNTAEVTYHQQYDRADHTAGGLLRRFHLAQQGRLLPCHGRIQDGHARKRVLR